MVDLKFADTYNLIAFLSKPAESKGFEQIVDFLNANPIRYALTINPTMYILCIEQFWSTVKAKTVNGKVQLQALMDGKKIIITESTVRIDLQLEDAEGVDCPPNSTIFEQLTLMGSKTTAWNDLSSTMASAIIYEAVYKELDGSFMRAATTASSLEAERVKKLEQKKRSRTHGLKRLYKVSLTARVESSKDEESLGEDASKQGRINAIDANEDITLVNDQDDADMFDVNTLTGDEVLIEQEVATKDVNLTVDEVTLAQALAALKSVKSKVKGDVIEEPSVPVSAASTKAKVQNKGKEKMIEPEKPLKKKDQLKLDEEIALKLQAEIDEEERLTMEKDEANVALTEEWDDIQAKVDADCYSKREGDELEQEVTKKQKVDDVQETAEVDDDQEATKIKELMKIIPDKEEVAIDAIPLATKPPTIAD
ncbi:hypothetical protein Tco_1277336 [Tanacetum coccineum]